MSPIISPPSPSEYPAFYSTYVQKVGDTDLLTGLQAAWETLKSSTEGLPPELQHYRYAPGKWSLKEILVHLMDAERVFAYRALSIARREPQSLPGFDENLYAQYMDADQRALSDILEEFYFIRHATIHLFKHLDEASLNFFGAVNQRPMTARALGYIILGHQIHHLQVFRERYQ